VHHKKGRPSTAASHESRPGNPSFCVLRPPHQRITSDCGRTDNSEIQGLSRPWDTIPIQTQDATQQRGAATTRREASLGAYHVTNYTTDTRTSKNPDSNPQAPTQLTRRNKRCNPDGREHGNNAHHPHPRRAQPASMIGPYDPCKTTNTAAPT